MGTARRILADKVPKQVICGGRIGACQPRRRGLEGGIGRGCMVWGSTEHCMVSGSALTLRVSKDRAIRLRYIISKYFRYLSV